MKTESFSDEYIQTTNMSTSIGKSAREIERCIIYIVYTRLMNIWCVYIRETGLKGETYKKLWAAYNII